ncbi:MAG: class I SAM-dependent methyltransferase [Acidobacteriota bacterium]|nr:class I SAM-dependent methyltransferase [Acidobacteriota bacterium]
MKTDKTAKELAFLHDLYVATDWSERFAQLIDSSLKPVEEGQLLYVECGTGSHALELREKLNEPVEMICTESDIERLRIAQAKAEAVSADIKFQNSPPHKLNFPNAEFSAVVCDASFVPVPDLLPIWQEIYRVTEEEGTVAFVLPTAGSFGEFFSVFWQALHELELDELGEEVEKLITELPKVSDIKDVATNAGFQDVQAEARQEIFEYDLGEDFIRSPLVSDFLFPVWTEFVPPEQQIRLIRKIEDVINQTRDEMSFRLTVKMTLVTARKV